MAIYAVMQSPASVPKIRSMPSRMSFGGDQSSFKPSSTPRSSWTSSMNKDDSYSSAGSSISKTTGCWHRLTHCGGSDSSTSEDAAVDSVVVGSYRSKSTDADDAEKCQQCNVAPEAAFSYDSEVFEEINRFHRKKHEGTIDVWWLFDDGGELLLLLNCCCGDDTLRNASLKKTDKWLYHEKKVIEQRIYLRFNSLATYKI